VVDPHDEEMRQRVLSQWASSKYAIFEEKGFVPHLRASTKMEIDPDPHFDARIEEMTRVDPSDYWDETGIRNTDGPGIQSKWPIKFGHLILRGITLPDLTGYDDWSGIWFGFELGPGIDRGDCRLLVGQERRKPKPNALLYCRKRGRGTRGDDGRPAYDSRGECNFFRRSK